MPSFDTFPLLYWIFVYPLCWIVLWVAIRRPLVNIKLSNPAFMAATLGLLFFLRLPSIVFDREINPDESQMIAQAMTLHQDPVYFRSVDGTTGGPLDSYALVIPAFFGLSFDYVAAHLMAFALVGLSLILLFATAQLWFGSEAARLAVIPLVALLGLTQNGDFLHYNSELVAVALLSGAYYLLALLLRQSKPAIGLLIGMGLLLGMVPFGKLQGVPIAAVVGLFAGLAVLMHTNLTTGQKLIRLVSLGAGAVLFPAFFVGMAWLNGVYDDFVTFYIIANIQYASDADPIQSLLNLPRFFQKGEEFDWFVKLTVGVWLIWLVTNLSRRGAKARKPQGFLLTFLSVLTLATLFSIIRTGSEYVHYLYFLVGPLFLWLACGFMAIKNQWSDSTLRHWLPTGIVSVFLLAFLVEAGVNHLTGKPLNRYPTDQQGGWHMAMLPVSKAVLHYAKPGEKLAVWGWRCDYYVQTQMPQGVAENHTIRSVYNHSLRDVYQRRYVDNLIHSFPPVFVDAVGKNDLWLTNRKTQGHETYPPLERFIKENYQYVGLVEDSRIYVRNDRVDLQREKPTDKPPLLVERNHVD